MPYRLLVAFLLFPPAESASAPGKTQVALLGTGTPNADPDRSGPAVAIVVNDTPYIVDCGPGVVRRAAAAARNGVKGLSVEKLRRLFITHLHSDHTAGLPDFIFTPAVLERDAPLEIYGPRGTRTMTGHILIAACNGCDVLVHEVYSTAGFARRSPEWQRYHSNFQTSSKELAEIATKAKPGLLVLYHQLLWGTTPEQLVEEVKRGYVGKVVFGNDLDTH